MLYGASETHTSLILTTEYSLTGLFFLSFIDDSNNFPGLKPPFYRLTNPEVKNMYNLVIISGLQVETFS